MASNKIDLMTLINMSNASSPETYMMQKILFSKLHVHDNLVSKFLQFYRKMSQNFKNF